jgi:hypothetical protein
MEGQAVRPYQQCVIPQQVQFANCYTQFDHVVYIGSIRVTITHIEGYVAQV